jgi:putative adenylate-forming enzyme
MRLTYHCRRLADFAAGVRHRKALLDMERAPREAIAAWQQQRLDELVAHARAHSAFHRERLPAAGPVELGALPTMTKAQMMEHYDAVVCDPRLRRDPLLAWVEALRRDELYRGAFRVMTTSGSSGRKGLFVYDRAAWSWYLGVFLRQSATMGVAPRVPRRRLATLTGALPAQMSRQLFHSVSVGAHRVLTLDLRAPIDALVAELNAFGPDMLTGYPSVLARLAEEQADGRLRLAPETLVTSSEQLTPQIATRLRDAFGVAPFDVYACTEGLWGITCEHGQMHLFEDVALVENVDADGRPVPDGEAGARLLVTNLVNRVQPLIRLEVTDVMVLDRTPCPCGRTLVRATTIAGRADDVVRLSGRDGRPVSVLPHEFGLISHDRDVCEFQVVQHGPALDVAIVARSDHDDVADRVGAKLRTRLAQLGADAPEVRVALVDALARTTGGKLQLVVADPSAGDGDRDAVGVAGQPARE